MNHSIRYSTAMSNQTLTLLGLENYQVTLPGPRIQTLIERAAREIQIAGTRSSRMLPYADLVRRHIHEVAWSTRLDGRAPEFSSAAYPNLPKVVFLTPLAFVHLPPNIVLNAVSPYALQENLIHEALHHELAARLRHNCRLSQFLSARNQAKEIKVPWRSTSWTVEHALHAYFVYLNLVTVRAFHLDAEILGANESAPIETARADVSEILSILQRQLNQFLQPVDANWHRWLLSRGSLEVAPIRPAKS